MDGSKEEYVVKNREKAKKRQKLVILISIISFFGSTVMAAIPAMQEVFREDSAPQAVSVESTLKQQEKGFELVLQREPNNQVALDGLLQVRLQLDDIPGAIETLEKLVKLNPERKDYELGLENLKKELGKNTNQETTK
ncbi:tetratricopeptide repeat protein [Calothrix sp. CCY 0018]|uniref:tetratricopeptide repeat protein n=1 Tax=Calothrix sp. CCY 0018 TaxID=3103864 RepID=UPI0039C5AFE3